MVKNYSFLFIFFIVFVQCQRVYSFNFLTRYEVENEKTTNNWYSDHYFNTQNGEYYLLISYTHQNNIKAKIVDFENKIIHRFSVKEKKQKQKFYYVFSYENSSKIPDSNTETRYRYSFADMEDGSVCLLYEDGGRKKQMLYDVDLTIKTLNRNLFSVFSQTAFLPYHTNDEVVCQDSYLVEKAKMQWDDYTCNYNLVDYKDTALSVNIPSKLVFFRDNFKLK